MMTLLERHSLNPVEQFEPRSQPLNLAERASTTTIVVGPEAPEITEGDWIRDDTEPGKGIVWRVKAVDDQFDTEIRTLQLEHIINTLRDNLMFGEVKPSDMGGSTTCTAVQAIEYILGRQEHGDWVLGTCSYNVSHPYNFNGDYLYDALETVSGSLADCWWSYDMSSYPFTLNIVERAEAVSVEMRMSRNLKKAKRTIDRTPMYTRVYPIGKNNLHIDGYYVSRNENIYERKDKTVTDQSKATKAELQRWAEELLGRHCEPSMTVTVTARDLSKGTGESLDHIVLGAKCRMPIPKYNVLIEEIITKISYADKIRDPEEATVTMANIREDVASIINQLIKSGGAGGRAGAKNAEEDHAWIDDTTEHVRLVAEAFIGRDSQGQPVDWSRVAQLGVDQNGISGRVTRTEGDMVTAQAAIEANESAITAEVTRATGQEGALSGAIDIEAGKVQQIVTAVGADGQVTAASICLAINQSGESTAVIDAEKIYALGQFIADTISANYIANKIAAIGTINANNILAGSVSVVVGQTTSPVATQIYVSGCPYDLRITQSGNTYTLQQKRLGYEAVWTDVGSFSRATTLSAGWDGNRKFTVGASPQGAERYTTLMSAVPNANVTWNGTTATLALKATIDDSETAVNVGDVTVNVANFLQNKTGSAKITQNGTYTPDTGYIGFSEIEIDVAGGGGSGTTTLSSSWSNGKITVTASPQGETLERLLQAGAVTWNGNTATIPISSVFGSSGQYSEGVVFSPSVDASAKINAASAAVTLLDPTWNAVTGSTPDHRTVTVSTSGRKNSSGVTDNLSKSIALYLTQGSWGSNKKTVFMRTGSASGTVYAQTEVDASSLVTDAGYAGRAAVTLNNPSWNTVSSIGTSRTVTVSTTGRTDSSGNESNLSKSVALYLTQGSWSSENKLEVSLRTGSTGGTVVAKSVVDDGTRITNAGYAGRAAVNLADPTWNAVTGATPTSRTLTVTTTGRTNSSGTTANLSKSVGLYMTQGNWSNKKTTVFMRQGSTSGTVYAQREVDASSVYNDGYDANNSAWLYERSTGNVAGNLNPGIWVTAGYRDHNGTLHYCGSRWYTLKVGGVRQYSGAEPSGVQTLAGNTVYEVYYDNGSGGTPGAAKYFKTPSGEKHTKSDVLRCTSGNPSGGGLYTYTFTVTTTSGRFTAGTNYTMWRA